MGGKPLANCRIHVAYPIPAWRTKERSNWTMEKVEIWVKNAGGKIVPKFDEQANCTHVVVDEAKWRHNTMVVQQSLQANENGSKISIVSPEWLEECLEQQKKSREKSFSWEVMDQIAEKETKKLEKQSKKNGGRNSGDEGIGEGEVGRAMSKAPQALIGEVFKEATDPFLGERDRRVLEAEAAGEARARKEREEAEAKAKEEARKIELQRRKERSDLMKKTVKKGRGDVFYENNHVFKDGTGFAYDIMLTKVDTLTNTNERINLTIFESNSKPHKYATNCLFAGTNKKPFHNILEATGSSMMAATRTFRAVFREHTGVSWDDRIKAHNERVVARQNREAESPGILSMRRGENGDIKSTTRADEDAIPFEDRKFEYMPPLHSAKGWLPDGRDEVPEVVKRMRAAPNGRRDRTEQWMMSGGSGNGPEEAGLAPRASVEQNGTAEQIDLTDDGPGDQQLEVPESVGGDDSFVGDAVGAGTDVEDTTTQALGEENFLAGLDEFSTQDNIFDMGDLSGQQQPEFNFDQADADFGVGRAVDHPNEFSVGGLSEAGLSNVGGSFGQDESDVKPAVEEESRPEPDASQDGEIQAAATHQPDNLEAGGLSGLPFPYDTQADQTQLAAMVGQDLLNMEVQENAKRIAAFESAFGGDEGLEGDSTYQLSAGGTGAGKRKHDEVDQGGEDSAAKRFEAEFEGESFAT